MARPPRNTSLHQLELDWTQNEKNLRRCGRFRVQEVVSRWAGRSNRVVDLSSQGMRVHQRGGMTFKTDDTFDVAVGCGQLQTRLHARVVWIRPMGWRQRLIGFEFEGVTAEQASVIREITMLGSDSLTVADPKLLGRSSDGF